MNIDNAHMALCEFVILAESLYGKQEVSFNIHLLTHLAESVRRHGPFSWRSAFKGTHHVTLQIAQNLTRLKELQVLLKVYISEDSLAHMFHHHFRVTPYAKTCHKSIAAIFMIR